MSKLFPVFFAVSCLITPHCFSQKAVSDSSRSLTFAERVSYQRAIEEVYWRHRIWPKENLSPKPPLDAAISKAQLENKVTAYLRNSQALGNDRGRPITPEQLQAEMERMAQQSKQPEVLRELFAALGNNPFVIAECLVRPVLAERMLTSSHMTRIKTNASGPKVFATATAYTLPKVSDTGSGCADDAWTPTSTTDAPEARTAHSAVWTGSEMIIWGGGVVNNDDLNTGGRYTPSTDNWTPTSTVNAPSIRLGNTAIWTGTEMIIWGGDYCCPLVFFNNGGRYNPSTDTWVATTTTGAPGGRSGHTAVWTGTEMIVWGGNESLTVAKTGGRYNPNTDSWIATSTTDAPSARVGHISVWTGSEMIVWSGYDFYHFTVTGGRYNPVTDTWMATKITGAPSGRYEHTAIWSGTEMIVWGGRNFEVSFDTGGKYDPFTDSWAATNSIDAPPVRFDHTAVWTGDEMIVWGGSFYNGTYYQSYNTGGRYNPITDSWLATTTTDAPDTRSGHTAVWTGSQMIVWGGFVLDGNRFHIFNTGGRYCVQPGPPITLNAARRKVAGINTVHLTWSGVSSEMIDVYRCVRQDESGYVCNPIPIITTANDGSYTDSTGDTGRASYRYRVCEAGTSTCSNTAEVPR